MLESFEQRLTAIDEWHVQATEDLAQLRENIHGLRNALTPLIVDVRMLTVASEVDLEEVRKTQARVGSLEALVRQQNAHLLAELAKVSARVRTEGQLMRLQGVSVEEDNTGAKPR